MKTVQVFDLKEKIKALNLNGVAVTVGSFDGLHLGHRFLMEALRKESGGAPRAVITFDPHPEKVLSPAPVLQLFDRQDQIEIFKSLGVNYLFFVPFDKKMASLEARQFAQEYIFDLFKPSVIVIGYDFVFGKNRSGDYRLLKEMGDDQAPSPTKVLQIEPLLYHGEIVSSSLIRKSILLGDVEKVQSLLGRPFYIFGDVVEGRKLGRQIGFPTANLKLRGEIVPGHGVYFCHVFVNNQSHSAVCNVGTNPTVTDSQALKIECHILNFNGNVYNQSLRLEFIKKIRNEIKFKSLEDLKEQITKDIELAQTFV